MPLESLSQPFNPDEPGRKLREVQVEHEPEHEKTAREHFEDLKKLPIYDEFGNWRDGIEEGNLLDADRAMQNLGSACELIFGNSIRERDKKNIERSLDLYKEFTVGEYGYALLAQFLYDPELAKRNYDMTVDLYSSNTTTVARNFILYVGTLMRDQRALEISKKQVREKTNHIDRLLSEILLDTEVNPQGALDEWEKAKSQFYDPETHLWHWEGEMHRGYLDTTPQLLAVLVQAQLEAKGVLNPPTDQQRIIPEERNF